MRSTPPPPPERTTASGAVVISINQLALLHGLLDRPEGGAESSSDLIRAAVPYVRLFRTPSLASLRKELGRLPDEWVMRLQFGRTRTWLLTPRGRAIVERTVRARVKGNGPYTGLAALREETKRLRQADVIRGCIASADELLERSSLPADADGLLVSWRCHHLPTSYRDAALFRNNVRTMQRFMIDYLRRHEKTPTGVHLVPDLAGIPAEVDFDRLRGEMPSGMPELVVTNLGELIALKTSDYDVCLTLTSHRPACAVSFQKAGFVCKPLPVLQWLRLVAQCYHLGE